MATVFDVARYILNHCGRMSAMKLQKLVYYAQAWHLVWEDRPLFSERIEAWANGPVVPALYAAHRREFEVSADTMRGDARRLDADERESIDEVVTFYGRKDALWLSQLTHREPPWKDARKGLQPGERGTREITQAAMREYYESLVT